MSLKGATDVIATSPTGSVAFFEGTALKIKSEAGEDHWTIHEREYQGGADVLVGIVPKDWVITLKLQGQS